MRKYLAVEPVLPSFLGAKEDFAIQEWIPSGQETHAARNGPDMVAMARRAMGYLLGNPQKARGYECRFSLSLLDCPPARAEDEHDPIAVGDTESRMELEFIYMRDMTGDRTGRDIEDAIRARLLSFVRDDGLCWCSPRCLGPSCGREPAAMSWTTAYLLWSSAERYQRTGNESDRDLCRRLVAGLRSLASRRGSVMWYAGGLAPWRDGTWLDQVRDYYPSLVTPLVRYWEITRDRDALQFAEGMTEGIIQGIHAASSRTRVMPDGSHFSHNCHATLRAAMGVAQLGAATGNARYVEWARRVYEYTRSVGTDWGWYPENFYHPSYRYWSETCITAEAVGCAIALAQAGYPEYWDHVERTVRNYLPEAQFMLTPEFEGLYRKTHAIRPKDAERGLELLRRFEGGFIARLRPNDRVYWFDGRDQINMMGCCPPSGMHALYLAWANTVVEADGAVYVNMALDRDAAAARVSALAPRQGRICVEARKSADYFLRPPSWAPQEDIRATRNNKPTAVDWHRFHIRFAGAKPGDVLQIDYPVPRFVQHVPIGCHGSEEFYDFHWIGNDVQEVSPPGQRLPIFSGTSKGLTVVPLTG